MAISGPGLELRRLRPHRPLLLPRFDCAPDEYQALVRSGHGPLNQEQISLRIDSQHFQVLNRYPIVTHSPSHAQPFENPARRRARSDRARRTQPVRLAVRLRTAPEAMALDDALEATA